MNKYTLTKQGKIKGANLNPLERAVVRIINSQDNPETYINDVLYGGCIAGTVGELIYYTDTIAWFKKYRKYIEDFIVLYEESNECSISTLTGWDRTDRFCRYTNNQNLLAWFSFETVCYDINCYIGFGG